MRRSVRAETFGRRWCSMATSASGRLAGLLVILGLAVGLGGCGWPVLISEASTGSGLAYQVSKEEGRKKVRDGRFQPFQRVTVALVNLGTETRVVHWIAAAVDNQPVTTWEEMNRRLGESPQTLRQWTRLESGEIFGPRRHVDLFRADGDAYADLLQRLTLETCVCADDQSSCWLLRQQEAVTHDVPIASCTAERPEMVLYGES